MGDGPMAIEGMPVIKKEKKPRNKDRKEPKQLPENPTSRHPEQLLNEMEGQLQYDTSTEGAPPNAVHLGSYRERTDVRWNSQKQEGRKENCSTGGFGGSLRSCVLIIKGTRSPINSRRIIMLSKTFFNCTYLTLFTLIQTYYFSRLMHCKASDGIVENIF